MTGSVLDILIYVFDHYMLAEDDEVPERETLAEDLERAGFPGENVERALDWLADLAGERNRPPILDAIGSSAEPGANARARSLRVFTDAERERLSADSRGYVLTLERAGILSAQQREIVIDRLMALGHEELDLAQLKWIVLMVLSSQPGQELACSLMEDLVFDMPRSTH